MATLPLNEAQIAEIRQIVRLEAARAAVYSLASESLDENISRVSISVEMDAEGLGASIDWYNPQGVAIGGGRL
jgi:hypothetical protein